MELEIRKCRDSVVGRKLSPSPNNMGGYEPIALLAPDLNVLEGSDISKLDGGMNANISLYINYEEKILESDLVYFVNGERFQNIKFYTKLVEYAKKIDKEVIMSNDVARLLELEPSQLTINAEEKIFDDIVIAPKLLPIEIPVISIFTIGKKCGQVQTEFLARKYFLSKGYNVMQIGSHDFMRVVGCLSIPDFMFDSTIDPLEKTLKLNRFIHKYIVMEKPDIILIGVPHPVMKYNDSNLNGLGIFPFIIQNAIRSDVGIINLHFGDYTADFLEEVRRFCKYRLDVDTRYFGISNTSVLKDVDDPTKLEYLYLTTDFVKSNLISGIGEDQFVVFSAFNEEDASRAFQKIENELQANPEQL